jgi:hypothetical protein
VNVSGALSLLASLKRGYSGERRRVHQNVAGGETPRQTSDADARIALTAEVPTGTRFRLLLGDFITTLWVVLLLSIVAYALIDGEAVLAELDGLDLVAAYSLAP